MDVNYPTAGTNNSSQGFRTNWATIKTDLDIAATELTAIQNQAIFKTALAGTTLNNDMNGAVISNALATSFRKPTFNLGCSLSGIVVVNYIAGDVQYGTISGNTTLQFTNWAPAGTQAQIELQLTISSPTAVITFPSEVTDGLSTVENNSALTITVPAGVTQMSFLLQTVDCGTHITIIPVNRPRISTAIQQRTPATSKGIQGDVKGAVCMDTGYLYVCTASWTGSADIWKRITLPATTW